MRNKQAETQDLNADEADNTTEQSHVSPKLQPFPKAMYGIAGFAALALAGRCAYDTYLDSQKSDTRTPEDAAMSWCLSRQPLMGKDGSACTKEWASNTGKTAVCVLNQMGFPQGDSYEGKGKKTHTRETLDSFVDTHLAGHPQKYVKSSLPDQYLADNLVDREVEVLTRELQNSKTKNSLKWFSEEFEDYKSRTGKSSPGTFKEFVTAYRSETLACMRDYNGDCIKMKDGRYCYLLSKLAQRLNLVQIKMHEDGKGQMEPTECSRTNLQQAVAYVDIGQQGCKVTTSRPNNRAVVLPGNSYHETNQAFHLKDWKTAEPYLAEIGVACDAVDGDPGHCSFGEAGTEGKLADVNGWIATMGKNWRTLRVWLPRLW